VLLPLLDGELSAALLGCATGDRALMEESVSVRAGAAVGVVIASEGYPDTPLAGRPIDGAEPSSAADDGDVLCFHAATRRGADGGHLATGGRVVTVVGRGPTLERARAAAYDGVERIHLEGGHHRTDIAAGEVEPALHVGDRAQLSDESG
jgi:phosphoribosylamine--glycine ligase